MLSCLTSGFLANGTEWNVAQRKAELWGRGFALFANRRSYDGSCIVRNWV